MTIGKLSNYKNDLVAMVEYKLFTATESSWSGELRPTEYRKLMDGDGYVLELEDGRRCRCSLRKLINRVVKSVPAIFYYHFSGHELL